MRGDTGGALYPASLFSFFCWMSWIAVNCSCHKGLIGVMSNWDTSRKDRKGRDKRVIMNLLLLWRWLTHLIIKPCGSAADDHQLISSVASKYRTVLGSTPVGGPFCAVCVLRSPPKAHRHAKWTGDGLCVSIWWTGVKGVPRLPPLGSSPSATLHRISGDRSWLNAVYYFFHRIKL